MEYLISKTLAEYEKKHWTMLCCGAHSEIVILISLDVFHELERDYEFAIGSPPPYLMFYRGHQVFVDESLKGEKWGFAVRIDDLIFHKEYYTNDLSS